MELLLKFGENTLRLLPLPTPKIKTYKETPFPYFAPITTFAEW